MTQEEEKEFADKVIRAVSLYLEETKTTKLRFSINDFLTWIVDKANKKSKRSSKNEGEHIDISV
jgi:hypothetical protein